MMCSCSCGVACYEPFCTSMMEMCIWQFERGAYSLLDLNPISLRSCNSDVFFPANSESFRRMAYIVNCTTFHSLTTVTRSLVIHQQLLGGHMCLCLMQLVYLSRTNMCCLLTLYHLAGDENTVLPQLASCRTLAIIRSVIPIDIRNTWVSVLSTKVQDYIHNSRTCGL